MKPEEIAKVVEAQPQGYCRPINEMLAEAARLGIITGLEMAAKKCADNMILCMDGACLTGNPGCHKVDVGDIIDLKYKQEEKQ
jgi:hypothetical protein